jgi:hypothetical protein
VLVIEPDEKPRFDWMQQTGTLKITIPGDMDKTRTLAFCLARHAADSITFSAGELKLLGGLITGEYVPDTPDEESMLGNNRFFGEAHLVEHTPPPTFDGSSILDVSSNSATRIFVIQYNAAIKAKNPIDKFLGLFKIIEDFYGPKVKGKYLRDALKESDELLAIATAHLSYRSKEPSRPITKEDFDKFLDKLVDTRHNCAHLKTSVGFGISHGDPRVGSEVEPLNEPLSTLAYEAIRKRSDKPKS